MSLSRVKTWVDGEVLLAADLNNEFNNILNNATQLISPMTTDLSMGGFRLTGISTGTVASPGLQFNGDVDSGITSTGTNTVGVVAGGASGIVVTSSISLITPGGQFIVAVTSSAATVLAGVPIVGATSTGGTPAAHGLYADNVPKAWVIFSATSGTPNGVIKAGFNVTSVTYNAVGNFTVNWLRPFASTNYSVTGMAGPTSIPTWVWPLSAPTAGTAQIGVATSTGNIDLSHNMITAFGAQ